MRTQAKDPSLLAGLLIDDQGNHMSPTHSRKSHRRYRYYVSQALLDYREQDAGSVARVPASSIEKIVTRSLIGLLKSSNELLTTLAPAQLSAVEQKQLLSQAQTLASTWTTLPASEQIELITTLIHRITVYQQEVRIYFSKTGLINVLVPKLNQKSKPKVFTEGDEFLVSVPANLKRCGVETKLIVPNGNNSTAHYDSVRAIQEALAKALEWHDALVAGTVSSTSAIAKELGVTQRYVGHLLKLAYLAPDIIQAICKGNIPPDLSLSRINKNLPLDWTEQRKQFGFPA